MANRLECQEPEKPDMTPPIAAVPPPSVLAGHVTVLATLGISLLQAPAGAQEAPGEHRHADNHSHGGALHFSHPMIAESPTPDTKLRFDDFYRRGGDGQTIDEHTVRLEAEYALDKAFSIEIDVPFTTRGLEAGSRQTGLSSLDIGFKFANFAFADHGLLLGYGIDVGLPTGSDTKEIGSSHLVELEPVFNIGYKHERLELVTFASFGIPINQRAGEEVETELGNNVSLLCHLSARLSGMLELDGRTVLSGGEAGTTVENLSPGVKFRLVTSAELQVGASVSVPLTHRGEFDTQGLLSIFYHF